MNGIAEIASIGLYFVVGAVSLMMAYKSLFSKKYLPFHEQAAGKKWNDVDDRLKMVMLSFLRLGGLAFLVVSMLLMAGPIANYYIQSTFYKFFIPILAMVFCFGLFLNNYLLYKKTKADAPWKESLGAVLLIAIAMLLSM